MKDVTKEEIKFAIMLLSVAGGTVSFSYGTFATKEYVKEAVIERLDRIEAKLDRIIESRQSLGHHLDDRKEELK